MDLSVPLYTMKKFGKFPLQRKEESFLEGGDLIVGKDSLKFAIWRGIYEINTIVHHNFKRGTAGGDLFSANDKQQTAKGQCLTKQDILFYQEKPGRKSTFLCLLIFENERTLYQNNITIHKKHCYLMWNLIPMHSIGTKVRYLGRWDTVLTPI